MVAIGIDLGTTNSCVSVYRDGTVKIIPNGKGEDVTPSYVCFTGEKKRIIGEEAKQNFAIEPENTIFDVKRLIGRKFSDPQVQEDIKLWPFQVVDEGSIPKFKINLNGKERKYYPEEISSIILQELKEIAEKYLNESVNKCVITVPAYFNDAQRQATIDAGDLAGLKVLKIINEPTAAALAYNFLNKSDKEKIVLVYDLGGGTFDISILKIKGHNLQVFRTGGNTNLGGKDFDINVMKYIINECEEKYDLKIDSKNYKKTIRRLRSVCEKAKIIISSETSTSFDILSFFDFDKHAVVPESILDLDIKLTREKFEELNQDLFDLTITIMENCLTSANLTPSDVDEIVLIGGSTRIPKIQILVKEFFGGKELNKTINPDQAVAHGAAISAAMLEKIKHSAIAECTLEDITPMPLGVNVVPGILHVIIPKFHPIPCKELKSYKTYNDSQTTVLIEVGEGEKILFKDNYLLGNLTVSNLPEKKAGEVKFTVSFNIDTNGILTVKCEETIEKISNTLEILYDKGRLSDEEKERIKSEK